MSNNSKLASEEFYSNHGDSRGLFETDFDCGYIFPIVALGADREYIKVEKIAVTNDEDGELQACIIMDRSDFIGWAVSPWGDDE
jgi:hypothetical protein